MTRIGPYNSQIPFWQKPAFCQGRAAQSDDAKNEIELFMPLSPNKSSNLDIRIYKHTAMVIADLHQVFVRDGRHFDYWVRFTDTWIRKNGKCLCWSGHATLLKKV